LTIDARAVVELLTLGFITAPRTIFSQVCKLRSGHVARYRDGSLQVEKWAADPPARTEIVDFHEACLALRERVGQAVAKRLIADVPVGVFLSGGIDSAIVTAVAAQQAAGRVKTFSATFPEHPVYD